MIGVDLHCFRKTARTWCIQEEVPEVFIDLQLGHVRQRGKDALSAFWSWTGQRHYTDFELLAGNASRVAVAVRERLDEAEVEFQDLAAGNSCLKNTFSDTVGVFGHARKKAD